MAENVCMDFRFFVSFNNIRISLQDVFQYGFKWIPILRNMKVFAYAIKQTKVGISALEGTETI